ncbi:MAG: cytochrome c peroxidase [Byssovorax sp.]
MRSHPHHRLGAVVAIALAGCADGESVVPVPVPVAAPPLPWSAEAVPRAPEPADNPGTPAKIDLGELLFYDPILSTDLATACASCHSEIWGMSDGLPVSIGVDGVGPTGPGREGPNVTRRNAATLWNVAYRPLLFADGRTKTLEEQVLGPLHEAKELGREPAAVVADLADIPEYAQRFGAAFPDDAKPVSILNLQRAIAAFERTLVSDRSPYDHYVAGDAGALSAAALRGMSLFAEVGCSTCHAPPLFEQSRFVARGLAPIPGVVDDGRQEVTHDPADHAAFRVATLRNVRETGPYFHTGAVETLDDAVRHEAALASRAVTDAEIADVVAFLNKGLTDPSRSPSRPRTVPSGLAVPVDGFRIPR